jgi:hypothetical protein
MDSVSIIILVFIALVALGLIGVIAYIVLSGKNVQTPASSPASSSPARSPILVFSSTEPKGCLGVQYSHPNNTNTSTYMKGMEDIAKHIISSMCKGQWLGQLKKDIQASILNQKVQPNTTPEKACIQWKKHIIDHPITLDHAGGDVVIQATATNMVNSMYDQVCATGKFDIIKAENFVNEIQDSICPE